MLGRGCGRQSRLEAAVGQPAPSQRDLCDLRRGREATADQSSVTSEQIVREEWERSNGVKAVANVGDEEDW